MSNKRTIVNTSTRNYLSVVTVEKSSSIPQANMTRGEYLSSILGGYPGAGTMREPAYSAVVPGTIGSRANGMFLN